MIYHILKRQPGTNTTIHLDSTELDDRSSMSPREALTRALATETSPEAASYVVVRICGQHVSATLFDTEVRDIPTLVIKD